MKLLVRSSDSVLVRPSSSFEEKLLLPYPLSMERGVSSVLRPSVCFSFLIGLLSCGAVSTGPEDAIETTLVFLVDEDWTSTSYYVTIPQLYDFVVKAPPTHLSIRLSDHFTSFFSPYVEINFPELQGLQFNQAYSAINAYLVSKGIDKANRLRASQVRDTKGLVLKTRARSVITTSYIQYVVEEGTLLHTKNKKMKLFSNEQSIWRINDFEHPASFQTFAMDPEKKQEIIDDLIAFINGKEYYKKIGKAWKRGYLLYGSPGTGKSTMIAAMANLLNYCIYDLELTSVHNNLDLKKLLTTTFSRSIIVIEDIDCSVNLTGNRIQKDNLRMNEEQSKEVNSVTLSGLLNFIDGIWSACGQERIIVFTTNHLQKLDPALIRRGRMDMRIELSYCTYEAFKVLAKNYLDLCDDHHPLFEKIKTLLEGTMITPADLAETLMARNQIIDVDGSLNSLIQTLERMNNYQRRQHYEHKEKQDRKKHKKYNIFGSLCSKS
ncbi:hypothetical protein HID58_025707 [Brassica napus]|uniref:AAA+ ATPase domain-containing protein n=1 Tax=Brassica napus TaxID=3708 RepID=A0ABQ8CLW7_BRANA|nr:hypothetical protein HID58_025707 [Brassica napus]